MIDRNERAPAVVTASMAVLDMAMSGSGGQPTIWSTNNDSCLDTQSLTTTIKIVDATSIFALVKSGQTIAGTFGEINCSSASLRLYKQWDGSDMPTGGIVATSPIGFPIIGNREYECELQRFIGTNDGHSRMGITLSIQDTVTKRKSAVTSWYVAGSPTTAGCMWGAPGVRLEAGSIILKRFCYGTEFRNPKIAVLGDSIVEGNSIADNRDQRWATLLIKESGAPGVISGHGGANSSELLTRLPTDLIHIKPRYAVCLIGSNDTVYETWLANIMTFVEACRSIKAIPILVTIPPNANKQTFVNQANAWILSSGHHYIDAALVLTNNNDRRTWNPAFVLPDHVHPSMAGHAAIAARAHVDCPFLFQ